MCVCMCVCVSKKSAALSIFQSQAGQQLFYEQLYNYRNTKQLIT